MESRASSESETSVSILPQVTSLNTSPYATIWFHLYPVSFFSSSLCLVAVGSVGEAQAHLSYDEELEEPFERVL